VHSNLACRRDTDFHALGFDGMSLVAKYHAALQSDLLALISTLDVKSLGIWIVPGWNEFFTDGVARDRLKTILNGWATQNDNALLKTAAGHALSAFGSGKG
jgi:hypothetical protein